MQKCKRCGSDYGGHSMGGPGICPACDCGYSVETARRINKPWWPMDSLRNQFDDKDARIAALEAECERLRKTLKQKQEEFMICIRADEAHQNALDEAAQRLGWETGTDIEFMEKLHADLAAARAENERNRALFSAAHEEIVFIDPKFGCHSGWQSLLTAVISDLAALRARAADPAGMERDCRIADQRKIDSGICPRCGKALSVVQDNPCGGMRKQLVSCAEPPEFKIISCPWYERYRAVDGQPVSLAAADGEVKP